MATCPISDALSLSAMQMCFYNGLVYFADRDNHMIRAIDVATEVWMPRVISYY